jgi:hypothetical protein
MVILSLWYIFRFVCTSLIFTEIYMHCNLKFVIPFHTYVKERELAGYCTRWASACTAV